MRKDSNWEICCRNIVRYWPSVGEFGDMHITEHVIEMGDTLPVHVLGRRVSLVVREIIHSELQSMQATGVIHPSHNPYSSPVIL